jgi:KipI family sensor histidine kinase inhibitor
MTTCRIEAMAEDALLLRFGDRIDATTNARVHAATAALRKLPGLECVPAYASVLVRFDPCRWQHARLEQEVATTLAGLQSSPPPSREIEIPVLYGGSAGPDLDDVARSCGLDAGAVVARHSGSRYRVAMLGFAPGFPYLLGLDPALSVPRRASPRLRVPAGSVAIGGGQTGIYPRELPGGWQLIGRTPLRLFDANAASPTLLGPGDGVRFRAIDERDWENLAQP